MSAWGRNMPTYAKASGVSSEQSRNEIERTLRRYGAGAFAYATSADRAMIAFEISGHRYRFLLPLPDRNAREFTHTPSRGYARDAKAQDEAYEQAIRQRWRALALLVKATLEAVETGIITVEEAFLAHMTLPDNSTVGDRMLPQLDAIATTGQLPPLLPAPRGEE